MSKPTAARVRELLDYDPLSGVFTRRVDSGPAKAGDVAGSVNSDGYLQTRIDGKTYKNHRLAWLVMTGEWPTNDIDHVNGCPSDNRFANLREASHADNCKNRKNNHNNKSGYKGVIFHKGTGKWRAYIRVDGVRYHLKLHDTPEEASAYYEGAAALAFGAFKRTTTITITEEISRGQ